MANNKLGKNQIKVLEALELNEGGLTAVQVRDKALGIEGDYGTRRAHAILSRLVELHFAHYHSIDVASSSAQTSLIGRPPKNVFKITLLGKKAIVTGLNTTD